ncbi:MAG TPA: hypothetical protein PL033_02560 [Candidatus Brocadiia bacterium]|nr:hypothetical protein [Candidatus Brocadiia bacterium]
MQGTPRIGLLPLYLKLYDDALPGMRDGFSGLLREVSDGLRTRGIDVHAAEICRIETEFRKALRRFEDEGVDLIVTLHLAYSPSLESAGALSETALPILILDATMDESFGADTVPERILYNHGIHGVMDMASVLRRRGKGFEIVAGHAGDPRVLDRAAATAQVAFAAKCFRSVKALRIGESFAGMGDFAVAESVMRDALNCEVRQIGIPALAEAVSSVSDADVRKEIESDRERYDVDISEASHARSARVGLGLRRLLDKGGFNAFSMNFLAFQDSEGPVNVVPFLEASKAMARGIGYSGEGDVLTACLVRALLQGFRRATFTEIFCPDWRGDSLFLSHMGECNPEVCSGKARLIERPFPYTPAQDPAILTGASEPGPGVFVNLAPGPGNTFEVIASRVEILGDTTNEEMLKSVRGWIRPQCGVCHFLEEYSRHGGTHHSALVIGDCLEAMRSFAAFAKVGFVEI